MARVADNRSWRTVAAISSMADGGGQPVMPNGVGSLGYGGWWRQFRPWRMAPAGGDDGCLQKRQTERLTLLRNQNGRFKAGQHDIPTSREIREHSPYPMYLPATNEPFRSIAQRRVAKLTQKAYIPRLFRPSLKAFVVIDRKVSKNWEHSLPGFSTSGDGKKPTIQFIDFTGGASHGLNQPTI